MIIQRFADRLSVLRAKGKHIQFCLDIGAYRGDFTETLKSVWPTATVWQFEADKRNAPYLQSNAVFELLGDKQDPVNYYFLPDDKISTGASMFLELTQHYAKGLYITEKRDMHTLDSMALKCFGNWELHGLVKLDTQGSELKILEGARYFLTAKRPRFLLIECSVIPYNQGAPLADEVIGKVGRMGYQVCDVFDLSYSVNNTLQQMDILFELA